MRIDGYRGMIDLLHAQAPLRANLSPERVTDVLLLLVSPSAYRALVLDRGWSHPDWVAWTSGVLAEQLFELHQRDTGREPSG